MVGRRPAFAAHPNVPLVWGESSRGRIQTVISGRLAHTGWQLGVDPGQTGLRQERKWERPVRGPDLAKLRAGILA